MAVVLRHLTLSVGLVDETSQSSPVGLPEVQLCLCAMLLNSQPRSELASVADPRHCHDASGVLLSTLPDGSGSNSGRTDWKFLGRCDLTFIRETTSLRELGGLDAFVQLAVGEVLHACRSYVFAFGGVALLSLRFTLVELSASVHKNQAQCLLGLIGDVVALDNHAADN